MFALRQLEYLVTVVDTGSFTRAAARLHVTQPALSHQVRALEEQAGGRLLERLPRSVRPTPMGRALLPHARAALAGADGPARPRGAPWSSTAASWSWRRSTRWRSGCSHP